MKEWKPNSQLEPERVISLISHQFPELYPTQARLLGEGLDNYAYLINNQFVFRFPKYDSTTPLLERECRILPLIAPYLPLPVPMPQFIGKPSKLYPYIFAGYRMIPGVTACQLTWSDEERSRLAIPLAKFLAALHSVPVEETAQAFVPIQLPENAEDLANDAAELIQGLNIIAPSLNRFNVADFADLVNHLPLVPKHDRLLCWVHNDLYPCHLLTNENHSLQSIIDWGDIHLGYPYVDLMIAFLFLPPSAHQQFRMAYGTIDDTDWARAQLRALNYGVSLVSYGMEIGDGAIRAVGEYALQVTHF